jgi:hypothetical protein
MVRIKIDKLGTRLRRLRTAKRAQRNRGSAQSAAGLPLVQTNERYKGRFKAQ